MRGILEGLQIASFRRGQNERPRLGADDMVGRQRARPRITRNICSVDEVENRAARAERKYQPPVSAFAESIALAAGAAHDGRDFLKRGDCGWQCCGNKNTLPILL